MVRRFGEITLVLFASVILIQAQQAAPAASPQAARPQAPKTHLKVGDLAPDFTLRATDGNTYKLSDFRGKKNVLLAMYVLAFTGG